MKPSKAFAAAPPHRAHYRHNWKVPPSTSEAPKPLRFQEIRNQAFPNGRLAKAVIVSRAERCGCRPAPIRRAQAILQPLRLLHVERQRCDSGSLSRWSRDMRQGFKRALARVQAVLKEDPTSGHFFAFTNKK